MTRTIDIQDWLASADEERRRVRAVEAAFAEPYRRQRVRDTEEAAFLRQEGTDEQLIGPSSDGVERHAFAVPVRHGLFRGVDLALLDPEDADDRRLLIEAEHPDLADAVERGEQIVVIDGDEVNPRLHLMLHEVLTEQLLNDDPPEVWRTARALIGAGYERHEIFHLLGAALAPQLWRVMTENRSFSNEEYVAALAQLPHGLEETGAAEVRARGSSKRDLAAKVRKAARQARKRNRRR